MLSTLTSKINYVQRSSSSIWQRNELSELIFHSGGSDVIRKIEKMIEKDPKRYMYSTDSPYHILNRVNAFKQTPLYVAAKYGHLDVL